MKWKKIYINYLILAEGIDDDSFELLDNTTIDFIIQKSGPRLIFKSKYWKYKNMYSISTDPSTSSTTSEDTNATIVPYIESPVATETMRNFCCESHCVGVDTSSAVDTSFKSDFDISFCLPPKRMKSSSVFSDVRQYWFVLSI